ncbi:MAG: hypothetical protein BWK76_22590 [Desulfobulbaceae bacterium A2]|nr:MAG: hypothetical protein BWK76_22590 [Desulfobulbaceae bacterium A2]
MPSTTLRNFVLELNRARSAEFCSPDAVDARRLYKKRHPTRILVFKCMDGRLNLSLLTGTPVGLLYPFRNMGGIFQLGCPYLGRLVLDLKEEALREGCRTLALCTYHFSKGSMQRGCAGHKYDIEASIIDADRLKGEFEAAFGYSQQVSAAIVVGVETDEDALSFHSNDGDFYVSEDLDLSPDEVYRKLADVYRGMSEEILNDLIPLVIGNQAYIRKHRAQTRHITELVHGENIIGVGRGMDWFLLPNRALFIGPYGTCWGEAVKVAGNIVLNNIRSGLVPEEDGCLLLISAPYAHRSELGMARLKARFLAEEATRALRQVEGLQFDTLAGVTALETRFYREL